MAPPITADPTDIYNTCTLASHHAVLLARLLLNEGMVSFLLLGGGDYLLFSFLYTEIYAERRDSVFNHTPSLHGLLSHRFCSRQHKYVADRANMLRSEIISNSTPLLHYLVILRKGHFNQVSVFLDGYKSAACSIQVSVKK